jgi:hypothetical protein
MSREEYTLSDLECGRGFLTSGEWTLIYRRLDGTYFTASRSEKVVGAELAGGGRLQGSLPVIKWCE